MIKDKALEWCLGQLSIHMDGDDNQAHLSATKQNAGFMTPKLVHFATGERWKDNYLFQRYPATINLPVGRYATTANFNDNPPDVSAGDSCQIDVFMENETRKQIFFIHGYSGKIYIKTIHGNNGGAANEWGLLERRVTLWEGSANATGASMQLSDAIGKFSKFEITYNAAGTHIDIVPTIAYGEKCNIKQINLYDSADSASFQVMECQLNNAGGSKLTIVINKSILMSGGNQTVEKSDPITIRKIVGIS